jgi:tripartite-type tricarboxylate transporter receptor subunit TctC
LPKDRDNRERNRMKTAIALIGALVCALGEGAAQAQTWPDQPVKLIVPFGPGGNTDLAARITADRLSSVIGQRFLVENRLGASGAIAAEYVAKSPPDGYTFFIGTTPQISVLPLIAKVNFDPQKDFVPVAIIATNPFVLGIHPSIPVKTLREFIDYVKARPGQLSYGSSGVGTIGHLCAAALLARAGLIMTHVPYKSGPQGVNDLVGGQLQMYFGTATDIIPPMRADKLTVLAVSSEKRFREIPEVPAVAETYPGFNMLSWSGILAPARTPANIVERLARQTSRVVMEPAVAERIQQVGLDPSGIALGEFAELIRKEHPFWVEVVNLAGAKLE